MSAICEWVVMEDDQGNEYYETDCENTLREKEARSFLFCPFCSSRISLIRDKQPLRFRNILPQTGQYSDSHRGWLEWISIDGMESIRIVSKSREEVIDLWNKVVKTLRKSTKS